MWSTAQRYIKYTDLIFRPGLNETIDQLAMANSVRWHGYVLRRDGGHVLRMASDFEVKCQRRNGGRRGFEKCRLRKEV